MTDSDQDGLSDGVETEAAFLTLWSGKDPAGKLYMDCHAVQVTASDSARAALLKDGTVLIFTGDGASLQSITGFTPCFSRTAGRRSIQVLQKQRPR
ncbi:MAG: hypothetical protein PHO37_05035 [Kiritimatiellae bacterium]|nr:hypothetical protein [Kiritimatiellia bacterium]